MRNPKATGGFSGSGAGEKNFASPFRKLAGYSVREPLRGMDFRARDLQRALHFRVARPAARFGRGRKGASRRRSDGARWRPAGQDPAGKPAARRSRSPRWGVVPSDRRRSPPRVGRLPMAGGSREKTRCQPACKPGSVSGMRRPATIPLGRPLRTGSSNPPERPARRWAGPAPGGAGPRRSYSVLLPVGFAVPPLLPEARWALTPPFHPYPGRVPGCARRPDDGRGGLFSVALSLGFPPPDVIRHRISVEPGLSSPAVFRPMTGAAARPADRASVEARGTQVKRRGRAARTAG